MKSLGETFALALFLVFAAAVVMHCTGCAPAPEHPKPPDYCFSEEKYDDEERACIDRSATPQAARACRRRLDFMCGW